MADIRATQLLAALPGGEFILKLKFLQEKAEDDWVLEDKFDPVRAERKKGQGVIEDSRYTKPGALIRIDSAFYQNAYPVTAVAYGLYPIRDPDPANLAPLRDGDLNCVAQRVVEHFEGTLRGQGLTPTWRHNIQEWEEGVHETGATVSDVAELEKILWRPIVLRDIAGEYIFNSGKYRSRKYRTVELICHNGHAWSNDLHFPQSREVHIYEGDVWHAIREVTQSEPLVVWLLGGQDRQLSVDQLVLQDGRTYRTQEHWICRGSRMGVWGYLPSCHPCPVWEAFRMLRRWLGPDTASCLPDRVWPAEVSQSQGGDHLLRESD